jgi:3-hydroxyisobutyrate dehydrogenase-like beta-hydroxyacid dehydrogenase
MSVKTVGLMSPGDMGHSIGRVLVDHGLRVSTYLGGRSDRSRELASAAGVAEAPSLDVLVRDADVLLSVLVPARATEVAREIATALERTGATLLYVDCNAISPGTVRTIGDRVTAAGSRFADVGIIGPPPRRPGTRFYASGAGAAELASLRDFGLDVRIVGPDVGQASGLKMCYGALTKGLQALGLELLVAAERMGLADVLRAEQQESIPDVLSWLTRSMPTMPPKAYRWVGEMEEVAATFADLGMTPKILEGAAEMYEFVAGTPIGKETPETRDANRNMDGIVAALAGELAARGR